MDREPTNEELNMMTNVAISYGAKGIVYWWFPTGYWGGNCGYSLGFIDTNNQPRNNIFGQDKWQNLKNIIHRVQKWQTAVMSFDNTKTNSYIYRNETERGQLLSSSNSCFSYIEAWKPGKGLPPCVQDNLDGNSPQSMTYDCQYNTYLQVATFSTGGGINQYFMLVNKRCSPYLDANSDDHNGGRRYVKAKFNANSTDLAGYNNWNVVDVAKDSTVATFNKNSNAFVGIDTLYPGEGKLYHLVPTSIAGGTLLADEIYPPGDITVLDTVYGGGHNITVSSGTNIHFTDSSTIVMNGGTFLMGSSGSMGPQNMNVNAVNSNHWHGFTFQNCNVQIYGASFSNVLNDTTYAINLINCPLVDVRYCTFNNESNDNLKGAISAAYYYSIGVQNIYIGGNTFNINQSTLPELSVMSYAGSDIPLIIENNSFSSQNSGSTAMLLSGVTGGAVKSNSITDCGTGINLLSSSLDIYNNTITVSSFGNCTGIFGASGSDINMSPNAGLILGGSNNISTSQSSMNIDVDNSFFFLDQGANVFNISDAASWHLYGTFPITVLPPPTYQTDNCFNLTGTIVDPPYNYVSTSGQQITFTFDPYLQGCNNSGIGAGSAITGLGNGINDTIRTIGTGGGGGYPNFPPLNQGGQGGSMVVFSAKKLYDSLCINMRFRHYTQAKNMCYNLINTYIDSTQAVYAISKLFLSSIGSGDTSQTAMINLKTFYENLILSNSGNLALVKRCNYFVQKCKVRLRDYSGALNGFQQIIDQNPTSYEALVARWDYMATSLLISGGGGGEKGKETKM